MFADRDHDRDVHLCDSATSFGMMTIMSLECPKIMNVESHAASRRTHDHEQEHATIADHDQLISYADSSSTKHLGDTPGFITPTITIVTGIT